MIVGKRAILLARTARYLEPSQIAHRVRLRSQRPVIAAVPRTSAALLRRRVQGSPGWPPEFRPIGAGLWSADDAQRLAQGRFSFLNQERELGTPPDWRQLQADQLWRFHLHYFEWARAFAAHPDGAWASERFREMWRSWRRGTRFAGGDAWAPYVASLRAWVMCSVFSQLVKESEDADAFVRDIALHAGFVRAHLEKDVGGNHLIKNIKALVGTGVFLSDRALVDAGLRILRAQLPIQILPDGGHFERSPSYHSQVLGDLLDVERLLLLEGAPIPGWLEESVGRMRSWLGAILMPDGDVPLLNDATLVGRTSLQALEPAPTPIDRLTVLKPSGYLVAHAGPRLHMVMDVGPPCPDALPAHAHADCLSFELAIDGTRIIVDSGTSTYAPGARRRYERSTRAHNTVEVDGTDQTEVWSVFRAARRARPLLETALQTPDGVVVTGSHDGYARLQGSPRHRRTWKISDDGVTIEDQVVGAGIHTSTNRLFLAPGTPAHLDRGSVRVGPLVVRMEGADLKLEACEVATGFGRLQPTSCLVADRDGELPHHFRWTILLAT